MKEQYKNSRLPHLLMIVMHGETLWSLALQRMDDDDDDDESHFKKKGVLFGDQKNRDVFYPKTLQNQSKKGCFQSLGTHVTA